MYLDSTPKFERQGKEKEEMSEVEAFERSLI